MMQNSRRIQGMANWKKIGFGVCICMLGTILLAALLAVLVMTELIPEKMISYFPLGIILVCSFCGSGAAGERGAPTDRLMVGGLYWLALLGLNLLLCDGKPRGLLPTALVAMSGSITAMLLLKSRKQSHKTRRHRIRRR